MVWKQKNTQELSMWLAHKRKVLCLRASLPWMPTFDQMLANFGLKGEHFVIFLEESSTYLSYEDFNVLRDN